MTAFDSSLTPAQHVARREAGRAIASASGAIASVQSLAHGLAGPLSRRFGRGERLDGTGLRAALDEIRAQVAAVAYGSVLEDGRAATRSRPKGESHEICAVVRFAAPEGASGGTGGFCGLRVSLTRRRCIVDLRDLGVVASRHLLERAIERDIASWTGGLVEVEEALIASVGTVAAWRRAMALGLVPTQEFALPVGEGLMLGKACPDVRRAGLFLRVDRNGRRREPGPGDGFPPGFDDTPGAPPALRCMTAIDWRLMDGGQQELHAVLSDFADRHAALFRDVTLRCLWPGAERGDVPADAPLQPGLVDAASELSILLGRPGPAGALDRMRRRRASEAAGAAGAC